MYMRERLSLVEFVVSQKFETTTQHSQLILLIKIILFTVTF